MKRAWTFLLLGCLVLTGCGYGDVSPATYEIAKSLYNISNRKLSDHVHVAKEQITTSCECGKISDKEAKWLLAIAKDAERERWQQAMQSARRLMEDQIQH